MSPEKDLTLAVQAMALEEGFAAVAVAPAGTPPHCERLREWLRLGWHADMRFMERNLSVRLGERPILEGARSVICLAVGYAPPDVDPAVERAPTGIRTDATRCTWEGVVVPNRVQPVAGPTATAGSACAASPLVAAYAHGRDYHKVLKRKCIRLMDRIRALTPGFEGRAVVDSGPVMERSLAAWSGLGWIGRNGCLYVPGLGSYVLLCEIVCNLPLVPGRPLEPGCSNCGACAEACPTGAIAGDGLVDGRKCASYLTIEDRGEIPRQYWPKMGSRIFGCDRCQEACPHNRPLLPRAREFGGAASLATATGAPLGGATLAGILSWSRDDWDAATRGSACRRATWEMFLRNAAIAAGNSADASLIAPLEALRLRRAELAEIVEWALARLRADR